MPVSAIRRPGEVFEVFFRGGTRPIEPRKKMGKKQFIRSGFEPMLSESSGRVPFLTITPIQLTLNQACFLILNKKFTVNGTWKAINGTCI